MLNCREISRLVSEEVDRDLPLMRRMSIRLHLMMCKFCRRYFAQIRFMRGVLKLAGDEMKDGAETTSIKLPDSAKERIRQSMGER